jgi:hypothetical protein
VATFDADEHGDLGLRMDFANLDGAGGQREVGVVRVNLLKDGSDLSVSALDGWRTGDFAGYPNRKEDSTDATFFQAGNVYAAAGIPQTEVKTGIEEALGSVGVGVNDKRGEMQRVGTLGEFVSSHGRYSKRRSKEQHEQKNAAKSFTWHCSLRN